MNTGKLSTAPTGGRRTVRQKAAVLLAGLLFLGVGQQKSALPPISHTCPMHPDVLEDKQGLCPICKMKLEPIRLDTVYSCPVHSVVQEKNPGKCPICRRELVQLTMRLSFTCPEHPEIDKLNLGKCPDGSAMEPKYTMRAHGNHNPQHGGIFFMAPDNWHHLEGTYPEEGVVRVYLYDDYTKALPLDQVKQIAARVVTKETFDSATKTTKEIAAYPLKLAENGRYLEGKVESLRPSKTAPAQITVKAKFKRDNPEYRFDFAFPDFSPEKGSAVVQSAAGLAAIDIPNDAGEILKMLGDRKMQLGEFIERRDYAQVWVPAFQSKDLALALDVRVKDLAAGERPKVAHAIERLVRAAWLLDNYGDIGDKAQIEQAYAAFARAADEVHSAFSELVKSKSGQ